MYSNYWMDYSDSNELNQLAMSEMSLFEQIKAIDAMIDYIEKTLPGAIKIINEDAESAVRFFRQNGRTDLADEGVIPRLSDINAKLEKLMEKMNKQDLVYLYEFRNDLYRALNRR